MKSYSNTITASINRKGVLDIDTVKGCREGMKNHPDGGCYGLCYAAKIAKLYGYDFSKSISREVYDEEIGGKLFENIHLGGPSDIFKMVTRHKLKWFRIGTMGDPSHDWETTLHLCGFLGRVKIPVVVTKHWHVATDTQLDEFRKYNAVFNTSTSPLDSDKEILHRIGQHKRLIDHGIKSALRVVSCEFGNTKTGKKLNEKQDYIFGYKNIIDNPLRIPRRDKRVICGDILVKKIKDINSTSTISIKNSSTYIGHCDKCPDQCGINFWRENGK